MRLAVGGSKLMALEKRDVGKIASNTKNSLRKERLYKFLW